MRILVIFLLVSCLVYADLLKNVKHHDEDYDETEYESEESEESDEDAGKEKKGKKNETGGQTTIYTRRKIVLLEKIIKYNSSIIVNFTSEESKNTTGENETTGNETGGNETGGNETGGNETEGNETEGNETEGNETGGNETGGNETEGNETSGNETSGNETSGNQTLLCKRCCKYRKECCFHFRDCCYIPPPECFNCSCYKNMNYSKEDAGEGDDKVNKSSNSSFVEIPEYTFSMQGKFKTLGIVYEIPMTGNDEANSTTRFLVTIDDEYASDASFFSPTAMDLRQLRIEAFKLNVTKGNHTVKLSVAADKGKVYVPRFKPDGIEASLNPPITGKIMAVGM